MPKFIVEQYEIHSQKFVVNAKDRVAAIKKVIEEAPTPKGKTKYIELAEDCGMSSEEFTEKEVRELIDEDLLDRQGDFLPTIRSVEEVK